MEYFGFRSDFDILSPFRYLIDPTQRIFFLYLLSSFLIAIITAALIRKRDPEYKDVSVLSFFFPSTSKLDWMFFVTNTILYPFLVSPFLFVFSATSYLCNQSLGAIFTPRESLLAPSLAVSLLYSALIVLALDFGVFFAHYAQHKIRILWQFHKVHHTATHLSPITVYRMHPIDDILTVALTSLLMGIVDSVFRFFVLSTVTATTIFNVNIFIFLFYLGAYHIRHSELWLSYGPTISKIFISPAQHQIHHSKDSRHFDMNFGFIFSFWDSMFGTLYIPKEREHISYGINERDGTEFTSVLRLYFLPFVRVFQIFARK